jgi:hypothetical protein
MSSLEQTARRTRLVVVALVALVLVAGAWVAYRRLVRERWAGPLRKQEARAAASVEAFCAADAELATDPFFQHGPRVKDAAGFLNLLVGFESSSVDGGVVIPPGMLAVPEELQIALTSASNFMDVDLAEAGVEDALAGVDTSMLSRVHEFDHWELRGAGSPLTPAATWTAANAPRPQFIQLVWAAKVHLVKSARGGMLREAAQDVRQLARLCLTTESLLGAMAGLTLLGLERSAHEWATSHSVDVGDWTPVDAARVERAEAVMMAAPVLLGPTADEATFWRALACAEVSRCVGLSEAVSFIGGMLPLLPEPAASRLKVALGVVSTPGKGCSFATARYFVGRPLAPEMMTVPGWMHDDVGGLLLLLQTGDVGPLEVLVDAGVPTVTKE